MVGCAASAYQNVGTASADLMAAAARVAVAVHHQTNVTTAPAGASANPIALTSPAARTAVTESASLVAPGRSLSAMLMGNACSALWPAIVPIRGRAGPARAMATPASRGLPMTAPTRVTPAPAHRSVVAEPVPGAVSRETVPHQRAGQRHAPRGYARELVTTTTTASAGKTRVFARNAAATTTNAKSSTALALTGPVNVRAQTSRVVAWNAST